CRPRTPSPSQPREADAAARSPAGRARRARSRALRARCGPFAIPRVFQSCGPASFRLLPLVSCPAGPRGRSSAAGRRGLRVFDRYTYRNSSPRGASSAGGPSLPGASRAPIMRGLQPVRRILELGGRRLPFLRWSVLRMLLGMRRLKRDWQVGDGREQALASHVLANARPGDLDDNIRVIDDFCATRSVLMNVGDEKGEILDRAIQRSSPRLLLELGTYCGYSGLRMARVMPQGARLYSIEYSEANAEIARRIWAHAGVADRLTVVVGTLGDHGATIQRLRSEFGFGDEAVDFVFI